MKLNKIWIIIGILAIGVFLFTQNKPKEIKKMAGETVSWSAASPYVAVSGTATITAVPSSMTNIKAWTVENIAIPSSWSVTSSTFSGGSGLGAQGCNIESGKLNCATAGATSADVSTKLTIVFTAPSSPSNPVLFTGNYTTTATDLTVKSGTMTTITETFRQNCGSGGCTGTQTYTGGAWGACSSNGADCGVCCKCSSAGVETYDSTQSVDCSATICPIDGCNLGGCALHIFSDYPVSVANACSALKVCTSNSCTSICTSDTDSDSWAGTSSSFASCYDCNNNNASINPSITEVCNNLVDDNCDSILLTGLPTGGLDVFADKDCSQGYNWDEMKSYLLAWATGNSVTYGHAIDWNNFKNVLIYWATH